MRLFVLFVTPALALPLVSTVHAQSDDCATPTPISGQGTWTFDSTTFTSSGFDGAGLCGLGSGSIDKDGFFLWTATFDGWATFSTVGSTFDTKISVHVGSDCAALCDGFRDDFLIRQGSLVLGGIEIGSNYLVQVGGHAGAAGQGTLTIDPYDYPCQPGPDDGFEDNDTPSTAATLPPGYYPGLYSEFGDADYYLVTVPPRSSLTWESFPHGGSAHLEVTGPSQVFTGGYFWSHCNTTNQPEVYLVQWQSASPCCRYDVAIEVMPYASGAASADLFEDNDTCGNPANLTHGVYKDLTVTHSDPDFYSITIPPGMFFSIYGLPYDCTVFTRVYSANCVPAPGVIYGSYRGINETNSPLTLLLGVEMNGSMPGDSWTYDLSVLIELDRCQALNQPLFEGNHSCGTARPVSDGVYANEFVTEDQPDYYSFCLPDSATFQANALFSDPRGDIRLLLSSEFDCGTQIHAQTQNDNERLVYTNLSGAAQLLKLKVEVLGSGFLNSCNRYDLILQGVGNCNSGIEDSFCFPAQHNSEGRPTRLIAYHAPGVAVEESLVLTTIHGPPFQFGYFLIGSGVSNVGIPAGQGFLCLSLSAPNFVSRYNVAGTPLNSIGQFSAFGQFENLSGTGAGSPGQMFGFRVPATIPSPGAAITTGSTWHFQMWHRDVGGTSNLSNGVSVTF